MDPTTLARMFLGRREVLAQEAETKAAQSSVMLYVPHLRPDYVRPRHLEAYTEVLDLALSGVPQRVVLSAPPRHGKSLTTLSAICLALVKADARKSKEPYKIAYITYAQQFSEEQSMIAYDLAIAAGIKFRIRRKDQWVTTAGNVVYWGSVQGPLTGKGVNLLLIDDPVKGRAEAESGVYRDAAGAWFNSVGYTRLQKDSTGGGASIVCMQTRFHPDDLAGRLAALPGWNYINIPAVSDDGKALWPERFDVDALADIRRTIGDYDWFSLYMGNPRPKGSSVFGDVSFYDKLPEQSYKVSIGVDFAYTKKTKSDYCAAVVLLRGNDDKKCYVVEAIQRHAKAEEFSFVVSALRAKYSGAKVFSFVSGPERGAISMLSTADFGGLKVNKIQASTDKFIRAQAPAAAWNNQRMLVPSNAALEGLRIGKEWRDRFVSEIAAFTGLDDAQDDQVDALSSAYYPFAPPGVYPKRIARHEERPQ